MALPSFICAGAQKAGTTWLFEMLAQNPSVWLPPLKEVHFFDAANLSDADKDKKRQKILKLANRAANHGKSKGSSGTGKAEFLRSLAGDDIQTEAWYRRLFSHPDSEGRITGEITPAYLVLDEAKIIYMKSVLPDTKIIILVREPRDRNLSQIRMAATRTKLPELSEADWKKILEGTRKRDRGNYSRAIPLWQKYYGPDQLLILPFSQLKTDPAGMMRTVESFIGAQHFGGYKSLDKQVHKTKEIQVPDWVAAKVEPYAEEQKAYLIDTFGAEFYEKTR